MSWIFINIDMFGYLFLLIRFQSISTNIFGRLFLDATLLSIFRSSLDCIYFHRRYNVEMLLFQEIRISICV